MTADRMLTIAGLVLSIVASILADKINSWWSDRSRKSLRNRIDRLKEELAAPYQAIIADSLRLMAMALAIISLGLYFFSAIGFGATGFVHVMVIMFFWIASFVAGWSLRKSRRLYPWRFKEYQEQLRGDIERLEKKLDRIK